MKKKEVLLAADKRARILRYQAALAQPYPDVPEEPEENEE